MPNLKKIFSKIYDANIEKIYRFVFLKVNSKEIAEDITAETFLRAWENFKNGKEEIKNPRAFLYQIARNLITDYYRGKSKSQIISTENTLIPDPRQNIEENILLSSDLEMVRTSLAQLPEDYQNVLIWYYLNEISIREIAKMLNKTESAVRVLIHRALNSLREEINTKKV